MQLYRREGSRSWYVTWNDQSGKRRRRSLGTADKKQAEALMAKIAEEQFLARHFDKTPDVQFQHALVKYAERSKRQNPKSFMDSTRYRLRTLSDGFGDKLISELTQPVVNRFYEERLGKVKPASAMRDVSILVAVLNHAVKIGLSDQTRTMPKDKPLPGRTRWLTVEEEQRLLQHAAPHLKPIIIFAVETGGRRSEILGLRWDDVDWQQERVTFRNTKNGEDRSVRLSIRAKQALSLAGVMSNGSVFRFGTDGIASIKTSFATAVRKAMLNNVRFHDLRHTFASRLVQSEVSLYEVMHMTGHKSFAMVKRYAHLAPDFQEKAIRALNAFGHSLGTGENGSRELTDKTPEMG